VILPLNGKVSKAESQHRYLREEDQGRGSNSAEKVPFLGGKAIGYNIKGVSSQLGGRVHRQSALTGWKPGEEGVKRKLGTDLPHDWIALEEKKKKKR